MKWVFILNNIDYTIEFLAKLAKKAQEMGDECLVLSNSKFAEFNKAKLFGEKTKLISKIDWCRENCKDDFSVCPEISWKDFFPTFDRKKYDLKLDYNNSFRIISQLYQFFEAVLEQEKPDLIVNEAPANILTEVAFKICQKKDIPYLGIVVSRFPRRLDLYDLEWTSSLYEKSFNRLDDSVLSGKEKEFADDFVRDFISHKKLPSYVSIHFKKSFFPRLRSYLKVQIENIPAWFNYFKKRNDFKAFDYETESLIPNFIKRPWKAFLREFKKRFFNPAFYPVSKSDDFYLFPLHVQPEASTSVLATYFSDQINTIRNIAFSLPLPCKLYVKEHPVAMGERSFAFYRELKLIPNVCLIDPRENTAELIGMSKAVISLTSTLALEAAISGKQVYLLGEVFFQYHPLCRKVSGFRDLKEAISADKNKERFAGDLTEINRRFIASYYNNTVSGHISELVFSEKEDNNDYGKIYMEIKNHLNKLKANV